MKATVFHSKANEMGDFYVYFRDEQNNPTFLVGTTDFSTTYIREQLAKQRNKTKETVDVTTHVKVWDWTRNRVAVIKLSSISKLVPLSTVLKNGN